MDWLITMAGWTSCANWWAGGAFATNFIHRVKWTLGLSVILLLLTGQPTAAQKLIWNQNVDEDLAGYKIYYGQSSSQYSWSVDVGLVTEWLLPTEWTDGIYYFACTAYDTDQNESGYSAELRLKKDGDEWTFAGTKFDALNLGGHTFAPAAGGPHTLTLQ